MLSEVPFSRDALAVRPAFLERLANETGRAKPRPAQRIVYAYLDKGTAGSSCARYTDGLVQGTFNKEEAGTIECGTEAETVYESPGSFLCVFQYLGKNGYTPIVIRKMWLVPELPVPVILSEQDESLNGFYTNYWHSDGLLLGPDSRITPESEWGRPEYKEVVELYRPPTEDGYRHRWAQIVHVENESVQQRLKEEYDFRELRRYHPSDDEDGDEDWGPAPGVRG